MHPIIAVVVTYNRLPLLRQCIAALLRQSQPCDILVVDNASTDGTAEAMQTLAGEGKLLYHNTGANLGGAGGFHYGMRYAAEQGYDYVWVMDDDCLPADDALEKLMEADSLLGGPAHYGFLSGSVLWTDGHACVMNHQKLHRHYYEQLELLRYGIVRAVQATFVSLLVPTQHLFRYGLPLAPYFIWNDDIEFTRRLAVRNRLPCYLVGQSTIVHQMGSNCGSNIALDTPDRLERYRYAYRNESKTYRMEGLSGIAFYIARCGRDFLRICFCVKDHRLKRFRILFTGMWQGLFFHPKTEYPHHQEKRP